MRHAKQIEIIKNYSQLIKKKQHEIKHIEPSCVEQWFPAGRMFPTDKVQAADEPWVPQEQAVLACMGCTGIAGPTEALYREPAGTVEMLKCLQIKSTADLARKVSFLREKKKGGGENQLKRFETPLI